MRPTSLRLAAATLSVALSAGVLAGCSASKGSPSAATPAPYTLVTQAALRPGDPVPAPKGKPVLTLRGVPVHNVGRTLQFDLATLDRLGTVAYTVFDRQAEGRDVRFSGPLLRTVLSVAGIGDPRQVSLHCRALNDYDVTIPASDVLAFPVLLATRADGKRMSVSHYGPTRVVYPTKGYHLDKTVYDPRWIWQLSDVRVH